MTEHKFTDEVVLEGLRLWTEAKCVKCSAMGSICCNSCVITVIKQAAETINRQKAEIERLEHLRAELSKEVADLKDELICEKETNAHLCGEYMTANSEAIKEYLTTVLGKKDIAGHYAPDYEVVSVSVLEYYAKAMEDGKL